MWVGQIVPVPSPERWVLKSHLAADADYRGLEGTRDSTDAIWSFF